MTKSIYIIKTAMIALVFLLVVGNTFAQAGSTVTGTVKDEDGKPVVGAVVLQAGTANGTTSMADGKFSIKLIDGENALDVSILGYETQKVQLGGKTSVDVVLRSSDVAIDDIVVIGYGSVKRSDVTGSVASVKSKDLVMPSTANVGSMLRGKASGLNITQSSAKPGGELNISIRGQKAPLIIIDGVAQTKFAQQGTGTVYSGGNTDSQMIGVNPDDVESIDILKDAASTAIYGADAAGGVILITTKKGKASQQGKVDIAYTGGFSIQYLSDYPEFLDAKDFMIEQNKVFYELDNSVGRYSRHSQDKIDNFRGKGTQWIDKVTRTGIVNEQNLSIRSGTERTQYLISGSYYDNKAVARNNEMNRLTGRINLDQKFNKWLDGGVNTSYARIKYNQVPLGDQRQEKSALIYSAMTFNPLVPVYDEDGKYTDNPDRSIYANPVSLLEISDETINHNLNANAFLNASLFKGFSVRASIGVDYKDSKSHQYVPSTTKVGASKGGIATKNNGTSQMMLTNVVATYNTTIREDHALNVMAGWEFTRNTWEGTSITASNFPTDTPLWNNLQSSEQEKPSISSYKGSSELVSFISRVNYSFRGKYIFTGNLRVDGSSNFSKNHQYGTFAGVSGAWKIAEEPFIKDNVSWINELKLRASWGQVGNAGSLTGINTYYKIRPKDYAFNGSMVNGAALAQLGNPNLKWQTASDINFGLDFGFVKNRISGSVEWFQRRETDIILQKSLMSYNQVRTIDYNSGEVWRTRGVDITLRSVNISTKDFSWSTDVNLNFYASYTVERDPDYNYPYIYSGTREKWYNTYLYKSMGLIGANESVPWMPTSGAGNIKFADLNGYVTDESGTRLRDANGRYMYTGGPDGILDEADYYIAGNSTPIPFGFSNTFRYKNWDMNVYIYGSLNGYKQNDILMQSSWGITDMTYGLNAVTAVKNRWSPDNPTGTQPSVSQGASGVDILQGDFYYEKSWFARLDNISIGYTLPSHLLKKYISKLRVYAAARNVCVITPYGGMDPETGNGIGAYPNQRTFVLGLNLNF